MTGNGNMMAAILSSIDTSKYQITCFASEGKSSATLTAFRPLPFAMIDAQAQGDLWGAYKLLDILRSVKIDVLLMVGIDIWQYAHIFQQIDEIRKQKGFKWAAIFPYDLQQVRYDWISWINLLDYPHVYSQYGFDILKDHVSGIRYFRPPLHNAAAFRPLEVNIQKKLRREIFPTIRDNDMIFGFVGVNAFRKDTPRLIKAFLQAKQDVPQIKLYLHTELTNGAYNLKQIAIDYGGKDGDLLAKEDNAKTSVSHMVKVYNCMDCLVNCTMQEGLSWTLLEAMLCGVPVIASDTTAQTELVKDAGLLIPCQEQAYVPVITGSGKSFVDAKACKVEDVRDAIIKIANNPEARESMRRDGAKKAKEWLEGVSDINVLLAEATNSEIDISSTLAQSKLDKVLFAQHSAAGDVFMTTRCFEGLKKRYDLPLIYMTSSQYTDIIEGNPYIDEVIPWDESEFSKYRVVVNPHGDRILPGHWGRNCNSILSDFYWKILDVKPDSFYIELKEPELAFQIEEAMPICIVHTTGGDPHYRTYKYMADVIAKLGKYYTVQLGAMNDYPAGADLDLRGKLSFKESAWVMDKAVLAITVDSFMSHLAGAFGVSQVCLFGSGNAVVCRPNQIKGQLICLSPNYVNDCKGLGPCSAAVRDCPAPCTGIHDPQDILRAVKEIENNQMIKRNFEHEASLCIFKHAK